MARPRKTGLDYFSLDVDIFSDPKMVCISGEFGLKGEITVIKLLCAVYRSGYFLEWNDVTRYTLLQSLPGISADLLEQIVTRLVRWGFFCRSLFDSVGVLTSRGIQQRYFEATKRWVKSGDLPYLIVNATETAVNVAETAVNVAESTLNKRKEKENKKKRVIEKKPDSGFSAPSLDDVKFFFSENGFISSAAKFHAYYQAMGWRKGGQQIADWQALARSWELRESEFGSTKGQRGVTLAVPTKAQQERLREEAARDEADMALRRRYDSRVTDKDAMSLLQYKLLRYDTKSDDELRRDIGAIRAGSLVLPTKVADMLEMARRL